MTQYSNNENNIYNTGCHKMSNRHFLFYKYIAFFVSQQMLGQLSWSKKRARIKLVTFSKERMNTMDNCYLDISRDRRSLYLSR